MPASTALCTAATADLRSALASASGTLSDVHYGPALGGYALIVGDTLNQVTPTARRVTDGSLDADAARAALVTAGDYIEIHFDNGCYTFGSPLPPPEPAPTPATITLQDTQPLKPDALVRPALPVIQPLPSARKPVSPAYAVIDGLIALAELYTHGGAQIKRHVLAHHYDIRTSAATAYRVTCLPTETALTLYTRRETVWSAVETSHLPPLSVLEQARLFTLRSLNR